MKYQNLNTANPKIAELQSEYRSTWHVVHFIASVLFIPWIVIWIMQGVSNTIHNNQIDEEIEKVLNE